MLEIDVPGFGELKLSNAIFDYNGTLAVNGILVEGIAPLLNNLSEQLKIYVVTGDSFGTAKDQLSDVNCELTILPQLNQAITKKKHLQQLGCKNTVAIGNGRNDQYMLKDAALSIIVLGEEGAATEAMMVSKIVVSDIFKAIALLKSPIQLKATLRS